MTRDAPVVSPEPATRRRADLVIEGRMPVDATEKLPWPETAARDTAPAQAGSCVSRSIEKATRTLDSYAIRAWGASAESDCDSLQVQDRFLLLQKFVLHPVNPPESRPRNGPDHTRDSRRKIRVGEMKSPRPSAWCWQALEIPMPIPDWRSESSECTCTNAAPVGADGSFSKRKKGS